MNGDFSQLIRAAKAIELNAAARNTLEQKVVLHMSKHPIKERSWSWQISWLEIKDTFALKHFVTHFKYITVVVLLVVLSASGVSWAAEGSLPGDILYPVKININEPVRVWLATSNEAKAEVSAWQAERRLDEVEQLAVQGKLDASTRADLESRFDNHVNQFEQNKNQLDGLPPGLLKVSVNSNLEGLLKGHANVLDNLNQTTTATNDVQPILQKVQARIAQVEQNRERGEANLTEDKNLQAPAIGQLQAAQNKLVEVKDYINKVRISNNNKTVALNTLAEAEVSLIGAQISLNLGIYAETIAKAQAGMRLAQQAKQQAQASEKLKINFSIKLKSNGVDENLHNNNEVNINGQHDNSGSVQGEQTQSSNDDTQSDKLTRKPGDDVKNQGNSIHSQAQIKVNLDL